MTPERIYAGAAGRDHTERAGAERHPGAARRRVHGRTADGQHQRRRGEGDAEPVHGQSRDDRSGEWPGWNGWGNDLANTRFQPAAAARLTAADVPRLKLKWAFGFPHGETNNAQPTVVSGRVFRRATTATSTRSTRRPAASTGRSRTDRSSATRRRSAPSPARARAAGRCSSATVTPTCSPSTRRPAGSSGRCASTTTSWRASPPA